MQNRPLHVTLISWLYIILSIFGMIATIALFKRVEQVNLSMHLSNSITYMGFAIAVLNLFSAIFILRGEAWARGLFLVVNFVGFIIHFIAYHVPENFNLISIGSLIVFILLAGSLFSPSANRFFRK